MLVLMVCNVAHASSTSWILTYFLFDPLPPVFILRDPEPHFDVPDVMETPLSHMLTDGGDAGGGGGGDGG